MTIAKWWKGRRWDRSVTAWDAPQGPTWTANGSVVSVRLWALSLTSMRFSVYLRFRPYRHQVIAGTREDVGGGAWLQWLVCWLCDRHPWGEWLRRPTMLHGACDSVRVCVRCGRRERWRTMENTPNAYRAVRQLERRLPRADLHR